MTKNPWIPLLLAAPVLAEDAVTQVSVAVTWDAVENAAVLRLYARRWRRDDRNTAFGALLDGLEPGRSYTVKVKAVAGQEQYLDSEFAQITLTTLPATQLAAPVLSAGDATENSATVVWKAVPDAASYVYTVDGGEELTVTGAVGSRDRAGIRYAGYRACESRFRAGAVPRFRIRRADGRRRHGTESLYAFGCRDRDEQHFRIRISQKQDANLLLWLCP